MVINMNIDARSAGPPSRVPQERDGSAFTFLSRPGPGIQLKFRLRVERARWATPWPFPSRPSPGSLLLPRLLFIGACVLGNTPTVLPGPGPGTSCRASAMDSAFTFPTWPGLGTYQVSAMGNEFTVPV